MAGRDGNLYELTYSVQQALTFASLGFGDPKVIKKCERCVLCCGVRVLFLYACIVEIAEGMMKVNRIFLDKFVVDEISGM